MNTVDLRRPRRIVVACAAVAAFAWLGTQPASAEISNPNLVPADSAYIISIPSATALWSAWEANGLYDAYKKIMALPEVTAKVSNFHKELSIVESSLGFKIDGKTLSQVFAGGDIYMQVKDSGDDMSAVAILKISDQDKLTKLIDLAEKAAAQASKDDDSTGTADKDENSSGSISESDYQGTKIKTFKSGEGDGKFVYARTPDQLILANNEESIHQVLDRVKAAPASGTVATSEDFKKIEAGLAAEKGEIYVYGNQEKAMAMQSGKDMPSQLSQSMRALVDNLAPLTYHGASVKIAPKEISSYSYGILKSGTSDSLYMKNPGDKPLKAIGYIPQENMLAVATSLFDAASIYNLGVSAADAAKGEADKSSDDNSAKSDSESIEKKMKDAEPLLGFSVKNDLIPALGNEVGFALNKVEFSGLIPQVNATIMLGVADKGKMTKVVDSLERLGTNAMAAKSSDTGTSAPEFETEDVAGQKVKTMEVGLPGYSPGFVLTDDFLIIGSTKDALKGALEANSGGKNLASSDAFKGLGHSITANANAVQFADVSKILDVALQVTKALPAAKEAGKYIEIMQVLDVSGSASRVENGAAVSRGVLKLK